MAYARNARHGHISGAIRGTRPGFAWGRGIVYRFLALAGGTA